MDHCMIFFHRWGVKEKCFGEYSNCRRINAGMDSPAQTYHKVVTPVIRFHMVFHFQIHVVLYLAFYIVIHARFRYNDGN